MAVAAAEKLKVQIRVEYDQDVESPLNVDDVWKFVTLRMSQVTDVPSEWRLEDEEIPTEEFKDRVFMVSCYRHTGAHWFLFEDNPNSCHWDTRKTAGFLILKDPSVVPLDRRKEAARAIIKEYDFWCNGDCWLYDIKIEEQLPVEPESKLHACPCCECGPALPQRELIDFDSCGGYIGEDSIFDALVSWINHLVKTNKIQPDTHEFCLQYPRHGFSHEDKFANAAKELGFDCKLEPYNWH